MTVDRVREHSVRGTSPVGRGDGKPLRLTYGFVSAALCWMR